MNYAKDSIDRLSRENKRNAESMKLLAANLNELSDQLIELRGLVNEFKRSRGRDSQLSDFDSQATEKDSQDS